MRETLSVPPYPPKKKTAPPVMPSLLGQALTVYQTGVPFNMCNIQLESTRASQQASLSSFLRQTPPLRLLLRNTRIFAIVLAEIVHTSDEQSPLHRLTRARIDPSVPTGGSSRCTVYGVCCMSGSTLHRLPLTFVDYLKPLAALNYLCCQLASLV